jgi:peptidoglycan/LPS O-acetylase OafA/YrhL
MKRLTQLDGLRGIAALVVVVFHLSLIAQPFLDTNSTGDAWWWISETPLRLATDGTQAVLLFFVLSGLVVAIPAFRKGFAWRKYFASRFLRLYIPAWGALALAAVLIFCIPRVSSNVTANYWLSNTNAKSIPPLTLLADATLMKVGNAADNVLWSLRWEIIFSLLLPLFVFAAVLVRRSWIVSMIVVVGCVALTIGDPNHANGFFYLPIFFIGTMMASRLETIQEWSKRRGRAFWIAALSTSLFFMVASQVFSFAAPASSVPGGLLWSLVGLGAAGVILCAIGFEPLRSFLNRRFTQFLGKISFSLYLVHVPIIATLAFVLGDAQWWLVGIIGLPLSLGVATVFHRFVEVPSMNLAHRVGARAARQKDAVATPTAGATSGSAPSVEPVAEAPQLEYAGGAGLPHYSAMR